MLDCHEFYTLLAEQHLTYFCGVPDSTFKDWMTYLDDQHGRGLTNRIVAIERDAIGYAAGYYLASGRIGVVYLQNSGLGNIVNPLTSLADEQVCRIPILLLIGWRGEPGRKDEPQHSKMGQITVPLLDILGIRHAILPVKLSEVKQVLAEACYYLASMCGIFALLVCEGTFKPYPSSKRAADKTSFMSREEALVLIAKRLGPEVLIISTTGKTSRELFEYRTVQQQDHQSDFLMVGAMGLASSLAAEVALQHPQERIIILDGDAAALMSAGNLATIGYYAPSNLYHIIFDNGCHESTGGQPSTSQIVSWEKLALANAYKGVLAVETREALEAQLDYWLEQTGPRMLVVKVRKGSRQDLGRPTTSPVENRNAFMKRLGIT
jgi:phosphonopyruvate decarboxylase